MEAVEFVAENGIPIIIRESFVAALGWKDDKHTEVFLMGEEQASVVQGNYRDVAKFIGWEVKDL